VECLGLTNWNKQKVGALVLIFSANNNKRDKHSKDSVSVEASTKENSIDDIDEEISVKRHLVPSFKAFDKKRTQNMFTEKNSIRASPTVSPRSKINCNKFSTPSLVVYSDRKMGNPAAQMGEKNKEVRRIKMRAFKNLKFGNENDYKLKNDSNKSINVHFLLPPKGSFNTNNKVKNMLANVLTNKINTIINETLKTYQTN